MTITSGKSYWIGLGILIGACMTVLTGCGPKNYKQDADDRVYAIIDDKWEPGFGSKANYRTNDVPALADDIQVEATVPASGILTLPRAVAIATAHNREYQTRKEELYTAALDLRLVRHEFEMNLFGGGSVFYSGDGENEAIDIEANVGFNRLLAAGTFIATRVAIAWSEVLTGTGDAGLSSIFAATVTQPLLRGRDPAVVLENLTQAERDVLYEIRTFNRFRKTFVVSVVGQYYQALELYDRVQNAQAHYDALEALRDQVAQLTTSGRVPLTEVNRLSQEMLQTRDTLIMARAEYERFLDGFKITLGLPPTLDFGLDISILDGWKVQGIPEPDIVLSDSIEAGLRRRLDMANHADAVLDAQRAVHVAADSLRIDLRITGGVEVDSRGDATGTAGAILDLPLDRVAEQNVYRKALLALEQRRRDYDLATDTVRLEIREAHRMLSETAQRYQVLSEGLELAQKRLDTTAALLQYGRTSSRRVLSAQEDLYDARNAATQALVDYAIATMRFYRDTGVLHVRPDGMWERGSVDAVAVQRSSGMVGTAK